MEVTIDRESVGVCLTGTLRTLLSSPVVRTYQEHVARPLAARYRVDTHFAVVIASSVQQDALRHSIKNAYSSRSIAFLSSAESTAPFDHSSKARCRVESGRRWANAQGDVSVLAQWSAISRCYDGIEASERDAGKRYS